MAPSKSATTEVVSPEDIKTSPLETTTSPDTKLDDAPPSKISGWLHWHEPGTSAAEKRLLFKLDWFLLSYSCLSFFMKQVRACRLSLRQRITQTDLCN